MKNIPKIESNIIIGYSNFDSLLSKIKFFDELSTNKLEISIKILKKFEKATYEVHIKRVLKKEGTAVGLANGILSVEDKIIYTAENLKVGLFRS